MALNFPSSPSINDEYTLGAKTWVWNGAAWSLKNSQPEALLDILKTVDGTGSGLDADTLDGNHASAFYLASNPNGYTSNTGTVTSVGATAPLVSSGGTAPSISIPAANSTTNGYMSSAYASKLDGIAAGATANTGTVTSVSGTGGYGGLTLSGTITSSGSLTLGGTPTGTWPISITGSAATVGTIGTTQVTTLYSPNGATVVSPDTASAMPAQGQSFIHTLGTGPSANDGHILGMSWANTTSVYGAQIWLDTDPTNRMAIRSRSSAGVWNGWSEVLTSNNYTSYSPSLTGSGASGTWGINITGSAGSVAWTNVSGRPTTVSSFTNDSGYLTSSTGVTTTNNTSLNSDTRNTRGVTRLYRRDDNSDYSVQTYWTGSHWMLYGYVGDSGHAGCRVAYADSAGNGGVTSVNGATGAVTVATGISTINYNNDSNSTYQMLWGSGNAIYGTAGIYCNPSTDYMYAAAFQATSDETLKTNWTALPDDYIYNLVNVKYGSYDRIDIQIRQDGVSAQSLQKVLPNSVNVGEDGKLTVNYGNAALVSVIKLTEKVIEQEKRIEQLESLVNQLMQKLA